MNNPEIFKHVKNPRRRNGYFRVTFGARLYFKDGRRVICTPDYILFVNRAGAISSVVKHKYIFGIGNLDDCVRMEFPKKNSFAEDRLKNV